MLKWALKGNSGAAKDAPGPDDTLYDQPDTPAPVFAVRALKTALFGTPAPRTYQTNSENAKMVDKKAPAAATAPGPTAAANFESPAPKPQGILLTPGTGTTRRKRVSFGQDVKAGTNTTPDGDPGNALFVTEDKDKKSRPKSKLQQALENSRKGKKPAQTTANPPPTEKENHDAAEDVWEEVDEDGDLDVTVDLNDPHSRSGKYWKSCFESYHADAKAEMEKLVKYKQLAKSYAKMKDSEALDLQQKLQEERERVVQMEKKVAELGNQIRTSREKGMQPGSKDDNQMMVDLAKQTALALDYREQVEELEDLLDAAGQEPDGGKSKRSARHVTSPRTQKTLMETQRELRRARAQVKEMNDLRDEVIRLKEELHSEKQKTGKLAEENRKLAGDLSRSGAKAVDLEKKLDESKTESRQKEREFRRLKSEHDQLKENAKARVSEAAQVLQKKNETISELQNEIKRLKADKGKEVDREVKPKADRDSLRKRYSALANTKIPDVTEGDFTAKLEAHDASRRRSMSNGMSLPRLSNNIHRDNESRNKENKQSYDDEDEDIDGALATSRALRHRIRAETVTSSSSSVLSDRGNLQETRREASAAHSNRHSYPSATAVAEAEPSLPILQHYEKSTDAKIRLRRKDSRASLKRRTEHARATSADGELPKIDLVQGQFPRLGGPQDMNTSAAWDINTSKANLPADRRAAAIARLQRKKAERSRTEGRDKENMLLR